MTWEDILQSVTVLIVDDDQANVRVLERMLRQAGYPCVFGTTDPRAVLDIYRKTQPDLILLDLHMPVLDGLEVLQQLREEIRPREYLPIVVITADITPEAKLRALLNGAKDFLTKPTDRVETMLRIRSLIETRFLFRQVEEENAALRAAANRGQAADRHPSTGCGAHPAMQGSLGLELARKHRPDLILLDLHLRDL